MLDDAKELARDGMGKALDRLRKEFARIRAGRANPSLLDGVMVDSYGSMVPLKQVGTISVGDARLLVIKPYDRNNITAIEKGINHSQLGLNPQSDGIVVRVPIPPLTEQRRKDLVKQSHASAEDAKISMRQIRREANDLLKDAEKSKDISEDDLKRGLEEIQKITADETKRVDEAMTAKETEILDG